MKKKILVIIMLLVFNLFAQLEIEIQNKLTNINSFKTIDIGANTNQIKVELNTDLVIGETNNGVFHFL